MPVAPPLIGTYPPPAVRVGNRVTCLYRDADCVVTSVSNAPIPWPRVRALEDRGGSGLWVCDALVRAIRTESAAALKHHFGVSTCVVWRWRKAFGVGGHATTKGSKRAIRAAAKLGAAAVKAKEWTDEELDAKSATAKRIGLRLPVRWTPERGGWRAAEVALLGTDHDKVIAEKLGRTRGAARGAKDPHILHAGRWRAHGPTRNWSCFTDTDEAIGWTWSAVSQNRGVLKV